MSNFVNLLDIVYPLGQYLSQIRQSRQQIQSVEHGRNSIVTRSFAAAHRTRQAVQTLLDLQLTKCRHTITNLQDLVNGLAAVRTKIILKSLLTVSEIGIHRWIQWEVLAAISRLTTVLNTEPLTSISAQPSYILGGVA